MSRSLLTLRRSLAAAALALSLSTVAAAPAMADDPVPSTPVVDDATRPTVSGTEINGSPARASVAVTKPTALGAQTIDRYEVRSKDGSSVGGQPSNGADTANVSFGTSLPGPWTVVAYKGATVVGAPSKPFSLGSRGLYIAIATISDVTITSGSNAGEALLSWKAEWSRTDADPSVYRFAIFDGNSFLGTTSNLSFTLAGLQRVKHRLVVRSITPAQSGDYYGSPSEPVDYTPASANSEYPDPFTDPRAPQLTSGAGAPSSVTLAGSPESFDISWKAPTQDQNPGTITRYEVRSAEGFIVATTDGARTASVNGSIGTSPYTIIGWYGEGGSTSPSGPIVVTAGGVSPGDAAITNVTVTGGSAVGSLNVSWAAAWSNGNAPVGARFNVYDGSTRIGSVDANTNTIRLTGLTKPEFFLTVRSEYQGWFGLPSMAVAAEPSTGDQSAFRPTVNGLEGGAKVVSGWPESIGVSWTAPKALPDGKTIVRYEVQDADGGVVGVPNSPTVNASDSVSLRTGGGFRVVGYYSGGGTTESAPFGVVHRGPQITFPVIQSVTATAGAETGSVTLSWVSGFQTPGDTTGWNFLVYDGVELVGTVVGPESMITLTGLEPSSTHRYRIRPERLGAYGPPAGPIDYTAPAGPVGPVVTPFAFAVTGAVTLKTLVTGAVPLAGTLKGDVTGDAFSADLTVAPGTAKLKAYGFLPVTASVQLVPTTKLTGTVTGTQLTASVKARVKLPSIKVFGIQLAGGQNCQAKSISTIPVTSPTGFSPSTGGTLAGTFPISDLSGCGALNGLVSPLTAGQANAIAINLAKAPTA